MPVPVPVYEDNVTVVTVVDELCGRVIVVDDIQGAVIVMVGLKTLVTA